VSYFPSLTFPHSFSFNLIDSDGLDGALVFKSKSEAIPSWNGVKSLIERYIGNYKWRLPLSFTAEVLKGPATSASNLRSLSITIAACRAI
jgi:hypothetical protein